MVRGLTIGHHDDVEERIAKNATSLELLASSEGIEVTRQKINSGKHFYLRATDEWSGFELMYVLEGTLTVEDPERGDIPLRAGEFISHNGLPEKVYFRVETDVELLMVSSSPSFHLGQSEIQDMVSLAKSVEEKDQATEGHCKRLERLAVLAGERLGLSGKQLIDVSFGAYLHDIGKVGVPDEILNKTGALSKEEWNEMRKHPDHGAEMIRGKEILQGAADIVRAHHERYDGDGYPRGSKGAEIPIGARIVSVVDAYDAITSVRPYQKAQVKREAIDELKRSAGSQFDPNVVRAFIEVIGDDNADAHAE